MKSELKISCVSESTDRNCLFAVSGEHLDLTQKVWMWYPPAITADRVGVKNEELPLLPPADGFEGKIVGTPTPQMLSACGIGKIPDGYKVLPTVVWLEGDGVYSAPYLMNRPILNTLTIGKASPGQMITVYGRNLCAGDEYSIENYLAVFEDKESGQRYTAQILGIAEQVLGNYKPYVMHVRVPQELTDGGYLLSVNLLNCGEFGFSNGLPIHISAKQTLAAALSRMDFHRLAMPNPLVDMPSVVDLRQILVADGIADDGVLLQETIDRGHAAAVDTIILLPVGRIGIRKTLHVKENIVLQGTGSTQIVVSFGAQMEEGANPAITKLFQSPSWFGGFVGDYLRYLDGKKAMVWLDTKAGLTHLSIETGLGADTAVVIATENETELVEDSFLINCEINNAHGSAFPAVEGVGYDWGGVHILCGTKGVTMKNCKIRALEPVFAHAARHPHRYMELTNCDFEVSPHQGSNCVFIRTLYDSILKDNRFINSGRAFSNQLGMSNNVLIGNVITGIAGLHNASELMMSETGTTLFQGQVSAVEGCCLTLEEALPLEKDALLAVGMDFYAYVLYGTGMGQYKKIVGHENHLLLLEQPWRIPPDKSSRIGIKIMSNENLWLRNQVRCTRGALQFIYGAGFHNMIVGNDFYDAPGITGFGLSHGKGGDVSPAAFNFIYENRLVNTTGIALYGSLRRGEGATDCGQGSDDSFLYQGTSNLFGNVIRRNQIFTVAMPSGANQYYNVWFKQLGNPELYCPPDEAPQTGAIDVMDGSCNIVENNYIFQAPCGITARGGVVVCRRNKMNLVAIPFVSDMKESVFEPEYQPVHTDINELIGDKQNDGTV